MEFETNLRDYVDVLRRWLWLIALGTLLAGGTALAISLLMPPVYEAVADVASVKSFSQISLSPEYRTLSEAQLTQGLDFKSRQQALVAMARGDEIASAVIAELGSTLSPDERQVARLVEMVNVSNNGDLIRIKVQNKDAQKAATIANTWARTYVNHINQVYTQMPVNLEQIQAQADQAWQNYQTAEAALGQFIGQNRIAVIGREIEAKQKAISDLYDMQRRLSLLLQDAKALQDLVNKDTSLAANDAGSRLAALLIRANAATLSYSATPLQLQVTSASLNDATLPSVRLQIQSLIATLEARKQEIESRIGDPSLQQQILALQKELEQENVKQQELIHRRDLAWSTYKTLASKIEEVRVAQQSSGTIVRLASSAVVPERPSAPNKLQNTLLGTLVGFMLSMGIAFLGEYLAPSIRSSKEIVQYLGVPAFEIEARHVGSKTLTTLSSPEVYYRLWANLFLVSTNSKRTLVVASVDDSLLPTSADETRAAHRRQEPSSVAVHLGIVAAQSGRSVILVDSKVSRPVLDRVFGLSNARGWSNLLSEEHPNIAKYLQPTSIKNLGVVPSGPDAAYVGAALVSPRLPPLINALKERADLVIFDSLPLSLAADALVISKYVEGILLIITAQFTPRETVIQLREQLQNVGANLLGVIVVQGSASSLVPHRLTAKISSLWVKSTLLLGPAKSPSAASDRYSV